MLNEENQIHNFIPSSGTGIVINYGSGSGSDFLTSYGSGSAESKSDGSYGSGSGTTTLDKRIKKTSNPSLFFECPVDPLVWFRIHWPPVESGYRWYRTFSDFARNT